MIEINRNTILLKIRPVLNQPVIRSIMVVGFVSIVIKIAGFYKETIIAAHFGLSELLDTYFIAVLIPSFVQNVFVDALSNLFVPNYITELKTNNQQKAFQTISFLIVTAIVVLLAIACLVFSEYLLTIVFPNHTEPYYHLIRIQFYWILPCLFFWGYSSLLCSLLEVKNKFLYSTLPPIFTTITTVVCLLFFKEKFREITLAIGMLSGSIIAFFYLLIVCLYYDEINLGKPHMNKNIRTMIVQLPPKAASGLLTGSNSFVEKFFSAQLVTGSIAALNYGSKIPVFAVGMLILPLGSVLLPHFSRGINDDLLKTYNQLFKILKLVFFGSLIISLLGILISNDIVRVLFERKAFTSHDTFIVANIQKIGLLYIPFYLCTLICVKFLTAINKNKFMALVSFWNLCINLVLNLVLIKLFGIYGLAMSTTIMYIICSVIYVGFTYKEFKKASHRVYST